MSKKILVIEDDKDIAHLLRDNLQDIGYEVTLAFGGNEGLSLAISGNYHLIILDIMLPGRDGLEICRTIRSRTVYTPILMLTSRSSELDRVLGLELGADDYITKPFSVRELQARVKALFRRIEALEDKPEKELEGSVKTGDLFIDRAKRSVMKKGEDITLTAKEFDLLAFFARNPGRAFTRSDLLNKVWGYQFEGYEHTVNSHINRLRAKIEDNPAQPRYILTVWGVGYKFAEDLERQKKDV